jgi:hypothetical protein
LLSRKVSDEYTVPVCRLHHRELHRYGDEISCAAMNVDPLTIALDLWRRSRSSQNRDFLELRRYSEDSAIAPDQLDRTP